VNMLWVKTRPSFPFSIRKIFEFKSLEGLDENRL
jgi:hypothetical protein